MVGARRARSAGRHAGSPAAHEVRKTRTKHQMTVEEAANLVHATANAWYKWESGNRSMDPARWELFLIKIGEQKP